MFARFFGGDGGGKAGKEAEAGQDGKGDETSSPFSSDSGLKPMEEWEPGQVDPEYERRMMEYEMDCNSGKGNARACHNTAMFFGQIRQDRPRAAAIYRQNCDDKNYAASCFNFGCMKASGQGIPSVPSLGLQYLQRACDLGHAQACHRAGVFRFDGIGCDADELAGFALWERGCMRGDDYQCCSAAGEALLRPEAPVVRGVVGGNQSEEKQQERVKDAQESYADALAGKHTRLERDPARAAAFFDVACRKGHGPSCYNLAVMYRSGDSNLAADQAKYMEYRRRVEEMIAVTGRLEDNLVGS